MCEMIPRAPRFKVVFILSFLFLAVRAFPAGAPDSAALEETPLAVATRFARAFESQDFATVRALFTQDAVVSRVALSRAGEPRFYRFSAADWTADAERNHVYLKDVRLEILDSTTEVLEHGAVVSMLYRFSGRAGNRSFVSNGVDTYSLIWVGGSWRVLQYGYIERVDSL